MIKYLLHFSLNHLAFREAEWKSICEIFRLKEYINAIGSSNGPLVVVELKSPAHLQSFLSRSVLLKAAYELIHSTGSHNDMLDWLKKDPKTITDLDIEATSWCLRIRPIGKKRNAEYIDKMLEDYVKAIKIDKAVVNLANPTIELSIIEEMHNKEAEPRNIFLGKAVGIGQGSLKHRYSLKDRRYIGNTVMDPELSLLQSNLTFVEPGQLVIDPFCGTGGLLIPAAHFGAFVIGTEINYQIARAKGKSSRKGEGDLKSGYHSIQANFEQYNLDKQLLSIIIADASQKSLWKSDKLFDAIVTDPPYGVREKGRKLGPKEKKPDWIEKSTVDRIVSYPEKQKYGISNSYLDLMDFAAQYLRVGGSISFWYPIIRESYSVDVLPLNDCLELVSNCEQVLNRKSSRRLLVYRKINEFDPNIASKIKIDQFENNTFRDIVFNEC